MDLKKKQKKLLPSVGWGGVKKKKRISRELQLQNFSKTFFFFLIPELIRNLSDSRTHPLRSPRRPRESADPHRGVRGQVSEKCKIPLTCPAQTGDRGGKAGERQNEGMVTIPIQQTPGHLTKHDQQNLLFAVNWTRQFAYLSGAECGRSELTQEP